MSQPQYGGAFLAEAVRAAYAEGMDDYQFGTYGFDGGRQARGQDHRRGQCEFSAAAGVSGRSS